MIASYCCYIVVGTPWRTIVGHCGPRSPSPKGSNPNFVADCHVPDVGKGATVLFFDGLIAKHGTHSWLLMSKSKGTSNWDNDTARIIFDNPIAIHVPSLCPITTVYLYRLFELHIYVTYFMDWIEYLWILWYHLLIVCFDGPPGWQGARGEPGTEEPFDSCKRVRQAAPKACCVMKHWTSFANS